MSKRKRRAALTAAEMETVRGLWPTYPGDAIAAALGRGRTRAQVYKAARRLGLSSAQRPISTGWTDRQLKILRENYGRLRLPELVARLQRKPASIVAKAFVLGLSAGRYWSKAEDALIRLHYHSGRIKSLVEKLPGRTRRAVAGRAARLGLKVQVNWRSAERHPWKADEEASHRRSSRVRQAT